MLIHRPDGVKYQLDLVQRQQCGRRRTLLAAITTAVGGVPEPATWTMMILGFGLVGGVLRQQRRTALRFS